MSQYNPFPIRAHVCLLLAVSHAREISRTDLFFMAASIQLLAALSNSRCPCRNSQHNSSFVSVSRRCAEPLFLYPRIGSLLTSWLQNTSLAQNQQPISKPPASPL